MAEVVHVKVGPADGPACSIPVLLQHVGPQWAALLVGDDQVVRVRAGERVEMGGDNRKDVRRDGDGSLSCPGLGLS